MRRALALLVALLAVAPAAHAAVDFAPPSFYAAHTLPSDVAVGDVTGDGIPDLVTANPGSNDVSVLHGAGDGTFAQPAAQFTTGPGSNGPVSVALGDSSFRGVQDIFVANFTSKTVALLPSQSNGSFGAAHVFGATAAPPRFIVTAYLQGIPIPDLYTGQDATTAMNWYANQFDTMGPMPQPPAFAGPFGLGASVSFGPVAAAEGNVDGGDDDLVVASSSGTITFLLGDGSGSGFTTKQIPSGAGTPSGVAVADMNGDGKLDVITSDAAGQACVALGDGAGGALRPPTCTTVPDNPRGVAVGDVNADGKVDVVVPDGSTGMGTPGVVSVLLGDGKGGLAAPVQLTADGAPWAVRLADVNRDGAADIVTTDRSSGNVAVFLATGRPRIAPTTLAFGEQDGLVTSPTRRITIANDGPAPLHLLSALAGGTAANSYAVRASTCTAAVGHGASCHLDVAFRPFGLGALPASLTLEFRGLGTRTVLLRGTGVVPGAPRIRGLRLVPARARAGRTVAVHLTLSRSARLTISLLRLVAGHRGRGGRCIAGAGTGRRCTATVRVRLLRATGKLGANVVGLPTRRRGHAVLAGRYRVTVVARDVHGRTSATGRVGLALR